MQRQWLLQFNVLAARLQEAQLKVLAMLEDIDYSDPRGLKRADILVTAGQRRICERWACR